jgi:peptidyl-prolyl cis-trans isomerase A (cyclophilin A)
VRMRIVVALLLSTMAMAQAKPATTQSKPAASAKKPVIATKPAAAAKPTAIIRTTAGTLTCELFPKKAPNAVANFVGLATGRKDWTDAKTGAKKHGVPLYDGTIFHRVIPEFMIQGGDPLGTGQGGPGYKINDELSADLTFDQPGRLAYANSGPNTNGSQFFITEVPTPFLDPCLDPGGCVRGNRQMAPNTGYVIFGQCTPESVELVKKIARQSDCAEATPFGAAGAPGPCDGRRSLPVKPVKIEHISISGMAVAGAKAPVRRRPAAKPPARKP